MAASRGGSGSCSGPSSTWRQSVAEPVSVPCSDGTVSCSRPPATEAASTATVLGDQVGRKLAAAAALPDLAADALGADLHLGQQTRPLPGQPLLLDLIVGGPHDRAEDVLGDGHPLCSSCSPPWRCFRSSSAATPRNRSRSPA